MTIQMLQFEAGQKYHAEQLTNDSGDAMTWNSTEKIWSGKGGFEPVIIPNGIKTGCRITPAVSGTDNRVDFAAGVANVNGVMDKAIAGLLDAQISRGGGGSPFLTTSVVIDNTGAYALVEGSEGVASSDVRGAAGGPPFIGIDESEVGQIRLTSEIAAPILPGEIFVVPGIHREDVGAAPIIEYARAENNSLLYAGPKWPVPLQKSHTGSVPRAVYAQYYTPEFATEPASKDFKAVQVAGSGSSTKYYQVVASSVSESLNDGGFTFKSEDGLTDLLLTNRKHLVWFRHYPNQDVSTKYTLQQAYFYADVPNPVEGVRDCTATLVGQEGLYIFA